MKIVYSRHYDIGFFGLERLHPFDSRKYSRAWRCLKRRFGRSLNRLRTTPARPASREELRRVHTRQYLDRLRRSDYVALALELPIVAKLPAFLVDRCVLRPMRWGVSGSMLGAEEAMHDGLAVNLSGGYHHAKPSEGEGFCVYADIALAVEVLRRTGRLGADERVAYIDLDAHQGNGVCHAFLDDPRTFIFDMYNSTIYPAHDTVAQQRIDCAVRMDSGWTTDVYLHGLKELLPRFLDSISQSHSVGFAVYNAGTDVYEFDQLGGLDVTANGILERDLFVIEQLRKRQVPTLMLLSGGYSRQSYRLVSDSVGALVERYGNFEGDALSCAE